MHRFPGKDGDGNTDYTKFTLNFPSNYIALRVAEVIRSLKCDPKIVGDSRLLGCAFEAYVLEHILNVSQERFLSVKAENIAKSQTPMVDVPAVKKHEVFPTKSPSKSYHNGTLYIPEPNRPGIGFVMPPWLFQVTTSKSHSSKKLERTLNQFPSVAKWNLCFVIPGVIGNEFKPNTSAYPKVAKYKLPVDF